MRGKWAVIGQQLLLTEITYLPDDIFNYHIHPTIYKYSESVVSVYEKMLKLCLETLLCYYDTCYKKQSLTVVIVETKGD